MNSLARDSLGLYLGNQNLYKGCRIPYMYYWKAETEGTHYSFCFEKTLLIQVKILVFFLISKENKNEI